MQSSTIMPVFLVRNIEGTRCVLAGCRMRRLFFAFHILDEYCGRKGRQISAKEREGILWERYKQTKGRSSG